MNTLTTQNTGVEQAQGQSVAPLKVDFDVKWEKVNGFWGISIYDLRKGRYELARRCLGDVNKQQVQDAITQYVLGRELRGPELEALSAGLLRLEAAK